MLTIGPVQLRFHVALNSVQDALLLRHDRHRAVHGAATTSPRSNASNEKEGIAEYTLHMWLREQEQMQMRVAWRMPHPVQHRCIQRFPLPYGPQNAGKSMSFHAPT